MTLRGMHRRAFLDIPSQVKMLRKKRKIGIK